MGILPLRPPNLVLDSSQNVASKRNDEPYVLSPSHETTSCEFAARASRLMRYRLVGTLARPTTLDRAGPTCEGITGSHHRGDNKAHVRNRMACHAPGAPITRYRWKAPASVQPPGTSHWIDRPLPISLKPVIKPSLFAPRVPSTGPLPPDGALLDVQSPVCRFVESILDSLRPVCACSHDVLVAWGLLCALIEMHGVYQEPRTGRTNPRDWRLIKLAENGQLEPTCLGGQSCSFVDRSGLQAFPSSVVPLWMHRC